VSRYSPLSIVCRLWLTAMIVCAVVVSATPAVRLASSRWHLVRWPTAMIDRVEMAAACAFWVLGVAFATLFVGLVVYVIWAIPDDRW